MLSRTASDENTPPKERTDGGRAVSAGKLRALVGADALTTGFGAPCVDAIALLSSESRRLPQLGGPVPAARARPLPHV